MSDSRDPNHPNYDPNHQLSDGRDHLGDDFTRPTPGPDARPLGNEFADRNTYDAVPLGREFADPTSVDRQNLANSFADPNSLDDTKLGKEFQQTNSSAKKHHKPILQTVEAPFKKPGIGRTLFWIVASLAVVFLIILLIGFLPRHSRSRETERRAKDESSALPVVDAIRVERARSSAGLVIPGTTTPLTEAAVYARATGYLKKRYVDIGDHVHKGQLLAVIDAPDLDQQVDQAREQLRQAQAQQAQQETQLALTKVTVDRYRALVARGVFSRQDGDQQETNFEAQRANVAAAVRNVEAFRANLARTIALQSFERVTAPFDGVVTQRNIDTGAFISTAGSGGNAAPTPMQSPGLTSASSAQNGSTMTAGSSGSGSGLNNTTTGQGSQGGPLFSIAQVQSLLIFVSVPEGYASMVSPGQVASLHFQEFPDQDFFGKVTRTAASIDQNSRTLLTEVQVDNHAGHLLSGMYAVVTFAPSNQASPGNTANASTETGPLIIGADSIAIRNDQPTVAVIADNGMVHLRPVVIGRDFGSETEVVSGLHPGDLIATSFTDEVIDGKKVKPQENKKAEQKAGPPSAPSQNTPPGGSTQYADPGVTDQDMQGQNAKPGQKKPAGGKETKAKGANKGNHQ